MGRVAWHYASLTHDRGKAPSEEAGTIAASGLHSTFPSAREGRRPVDVRLGHDRTGSATGRMIRRHNGRQAKRTASHGPDHRGPATRPRQPRRGFDEEVVVLREQGQSYSAVARALGIKRAIDAQAAFIRAMRRRPDEERRALYNRESERLGQLEARIRSRDAAEPVKLERHLVALGALRDSML